MCVAGEVLADVPSPKFQLRPVIVPLDVSVNVNAVDLFPDQWIYVQSAEFKTGRITNFRNWTPELYGPEKTTILVMEYWCNDGDPI